MNYKRHLLAIAAIAIWVLTACNWTVGDCYPREEWEEGGGAAPPIGGPVVIISSSGSGDFGDAPPEGPYGNSERKIQCNKTDSEEEGPSDSSEKPTESPTSPPDPCKQSGAPLMGCTGVKPFDPRAFRFVTIVSYDGIGVAGGWQEAKADLFFAHNQEGDAACKVRVGMPLRAEAWGNISAATAAVYTANVANACTAELYKGGGEDFPPGVFCELFIACLKKEFPREHIGLGARIN
ncbi:hypothetical protein SOCE26_007760 [Sorangium cellulosum]|uniref:Uncharacterized protein n=1 Tax=Sorangium cellulosum TaxID=56 RepID=A0A2L0EJB7_SORCE|nr:hypothetical protein [Sorangium cellulosum]AUX39385.1 hypothetical protein SOCE26_007760 [Sorangium cellulosum]